MVAMDPRIQNASTPTPSNGVAQVGSHWNVTTTGSPAPGNSDQTKIVAVVVVVAVILLIIILYCIYRHRRHTFAKPMTPALSPISKVPHESNKSPTSPSPHPSPRNKPPPRPQEPPKRTMPSQEEHSPNWDGAHGDSPNWDGAQNKENNHEDIDRPIQPPSGYSAEPHYFNIPNSNPPGYIEVTNTISESGITNQPKYVNVPRGTIGDDASNELGHENKGLEHSDSQEGLSVSYENTSFPRKPDELYENAPVAAECNQPTDYVSDSMLRAMNGAGNGLNMTAADGTNHQETVPNRIPTESGYVANTIPEAGYVPRPGV